MEENRNQPSSSTVFNNRRFYNNVMGRIYPVMGIVFLILAIGTMILIQAQGRSDLSQDNERLLITIERQLNEVLEQPIADLQRVAQVGRISEFETDNARVELQAAIFGEFSAIINGSASSPNRRLTFATSDGRIQATVSNSNGSPLTENPSTQANYLTDPLFIALTSASYSPGQVQVGPLIVPATSNGFGQIDIYVPVQSSVDDERVMGVLILSYASRPLVDTFNTIVSDATTARDGRHVFLANSLNEIILGGNVDGNEPEGVAESLGTFLADNQGNFTNTFFGRDTLLASQEITAYDGLDKPWRIVVQDDFWTVLSSTHILTGIVGVVYFIMAIIVGVSINLLLNPVIRPIGEVSQVARKLAFGELTDTHVGRGETEPRIVKSAEVDELFHSIDGISSHINSLNQQLLDNQTSHRRQIEAIQRIGRTLATLDQLSSVLLQSARLICDELTLYNARVFLLDDVGMNAVLVQSRNIAEHETFAKNYKVEVGSQSLVGQISSLGQPLIDTNPHDANLLLRNVQSELGLPLIVGDISIGVLTIQGEHVGTFDEDDLPTYMLLADKLALAIHNTRINQEARKRLQQIDVLNRQLTRQAWDDGDSQDSEQRGFQYNLLDVDSTNGVNGNGYNTGAITSPITIRGQVIGALTANPEHGQDLTDGDTVILKAVADRVALAIENVRLFQETQVTLNETALLYQLSRNLNEADTLDEVIRAIITSVMTDASGGQVWVFDDYFNKPEWMEIVADYATTSRGDNNDNLVGTRLHMPDHAFLRDLTANQVGIISNARTDSRLDDGVKIILRRVAAESATFIPFIIRNQWRGIITMNFPTSRHFSEREGRTFTTLTDQAGVAIDNRLLLKQTEDALTRNQNLYAASRIINQSQNEKDLVYAAVATSDAYNLMFSLSLFEGELDATGWSKQERIVAQSTTDGSIEDNQLVRTINVPKDSPLRLREPVIYIDDTPNNSQVPDDVKFMREQGFAYMARFPLYSANQPIALFSIMAEEIYELTPAEIEVYRALTGQMSSQLEVRRQVVRTEQALDETRRLYVASNAIASAQDSTAVYEAATEHLANPFIQIVANDSQVIKIALLMASESFTQDTPYLECVHVWSSNSADLLREKGEKFDRENYPYGVLTAQVDDLLAYSDLTIDTVDHALATYPTMRNRLMEEGVGSMLIAPIRARDQWFGVIICQSTQANAFSEQYQRFMSALSDQVSIAVDNQQLFIEAQQEATRAQAEARRARALTEASQLANRMGEDLSESLQGVFAQVAEAASFDRWLLVLLNGEWTALESSTMNLPGKEGDETLIFNMQNRLPIVDTVRFNRGQIVNDMGYYLANITNPPKNSTELMYLFGKHITMPVVTSENFVLGALFMGRDLATDDLDERDEELVRTLATQVGLALDNRRLFEQAETERQRLRSILDTMPAGILVLDPHTLKPEMYNDQVEEYLGRDLDPQSAFQNETYNLYRTGTNLPYPREEMPIFAALNNNTQSFADDVAVIHNGYQTDLMVNAAPIHDIQGNVTAIVAAFQDISNLRGLENTLQENLRETVALYETQLRLSEAGELDEVLELIPAQLMVFQPDETYVIFSDGDGSLQLERYYMQPLDDVYALQPTLDNQNVTIIADINKSSLDELACNTLSELGMKSLISVPIRTRQRPIGWVVMLSKELAKFLPEQEPILTQLSDIIATAVDNRFLLQSQQTTLQEIGALYSATTTISRTNDLDQLGIVLRAALDTIHPDFAVAFLKENVDQGTGNVVNLFTMGMDADNVDTIDFVSVLAGHEIPDDGLYIDNLSEFTDASPLVRDLKKLDQIQSIAIINLRVQENMSGRMVLAFKQAHHFTDGEDRYLNTIVDSASVVVENILLLDQIQSNLEETSIMYQASRALTDAVSAEDIVDAVINHLIQPHVNQVFLALLNGPSWETPTSTVEVMADWADGERGGLSLSGLVLTQEQFPAWKQLGSHEVMAIDDIRTDPNLSDEERFGIESLDVRSLIIIPLRVTNREIGTIWLGSREPHTHTIGELRVFSAFSEQASLSMEAAYLLQQTERRARQLQTSAEVSQSAGQILDIEVLMPRLVSLIQNAFGYDHVQIFLMDEMNDWAILRASTGDAGKEMLASEHKLRKGSASVIGQVTAQGMAQLAADTMDANTVHQPNTHLPLTRSEMALPLIIKGNVIGALDVQSNQPYAFTDEDVSVLTTLAAQISVAIENANLYKESLEQADQMSFLFDVTNTAASATSLDEALENVIQRLRTTMQTLAVAIYLKRTYVDEQTQMSRYTMEAVALAGSKQPLSELEEIRTDNTENLIGVVSSQLQPYIVNNIVEESRYLPIAPSARSAILLPLVSGQELIGLITLEDDDTYAYDHDTLQLLQTLTGSISAIIQSAVLVQQLERTNEQLRELDQVKSDFLANMSHELRTPLNSIIGFSRVMLKGIDGELTEMQEQDLTTIYNSGQHLLVLINDILDQAKIAAGKLEVKPVFFDVKAVVEAVKSIGIGLVKDKPVNIRADIASNLPDVYGDETRTRQVLINLVSNATKFTEEGGIDIRAYLVSDPDTGQQFVRIDVADTGIGIAEKDLPLLFEAFRQVDSSLTRTVGGTGLGLPIAKSLVEMQGGEMTVLSEVNVGSTFSITIPAEAPEGAEGFDDNDDVRFGVDTEPTHTDTDEHEQINPPTKPTIEVKAVKTGLMPVVPVMPQKRNVLLIEDNKAMVDQFRRTLQREGFEVSTADHPSYAEAMVSNLRPTVLLMDVNFASGEGWNILKRLKDRDDTFDIPIVIVTLDDDSERAYQCGAHAFIQRPFAPEDLVKAVLDAEQESNMDRILIIDDQPDAIRLLEGVLNANGTYRVFSATNGRDGISLVARRHPDLIVLDLRMPDMDGFAVLQELRSNPETANIPVMVVTGEIDFNQDEQVQLNNIHILQKTDISQEEYEQFISNVQGFLNDNNT